MNVRDLEYLVALADHGTFGRAASACGVSQPTLSVQLRKLESELGVSLLRRDGRTTVFTTVGHQVLDYARDVLRGVANIRRVTSADSHVLRVGVFPTLAQYLLPHVAPHLRTEVPSAELHWVERKSAKLIGMLIEGALDAAIVAADNSLPDSFEQHELFTEKFMLAAPQGHELAASVDPVCDDSIADHELMLLDDGHCLRDHVLQLCSKVGASEDRGLRANSLETMRHMVASGLGVTLLPYLATVPPAPPSPGVVLRPFSEPSPRRDIVLVYRSSSTQVEELRLLAESITRNVSPVLATSG